LQDLPHLHRLRHESDQALAAIQRGLETVSPADIAPLLARRAELALDRGKFADALKDCAAVLNSDAKCALAHAVRAAAWLGKNDLDKALADADEAIWLDANLGPAYLTRGRIQLRRRDWDRALSDLTRAVELEPFDPAPLLE